MLYKLFPRLAKTAPPLPQPNTQLALGALLVRIALADREYQVTEVSQIDKVLAATFNLKPLEAAKLRAASEALERHAPGTPEFADLLRSEVPYEDRVRLADAMWSIALADGTKDASEEELLLATEAALGLNDKDIAAVRERALRTN